jgi:hypothetical protein
VYRAIIRDFHHVKKMSKKAAGYLVLLSVLSCLCSCSSEAPRDDDPKLAVTPENYEKLRGGMTRRQVEAILGAATYFGPMTKSMRELRLKEQPFGWRLHPGGSYPFDPNYGELVPGREDLVQQGLWASDSCAIEVFFNSDYVLAGRGYWLPAPSR